MFFLIPIIGSVVEMTSVVTGVVLASTGAVGAAVVAGSACVGQLLDRR